MKKFAVLAMVAIAFLSTLDSSEAQVLRRFRDNVRGAISPQVSPQPQLQTFDSARAQPQVRPQPEVSTQPRYVQPQVRIQRPAPQRTTSGPQQLTPYSRLTPQQRVSVPQVQPSNGPRLNAPVPVASPSVPPANDTRVRIVTYMDPRTGRTFQRRYLVPGSTSNTTSRPTQGQVVTGRRSIFAQPTQPAGTVTPSQTAARQSLVPPIQFSPRVPQQQQVNVSPALLPTLSGPAMAAPSPVAQPIAASIDSTANSSQVKTASAEVDAAPAKLEASSTGIPDLSGLTVDPTPLASPENVDQDLFFDNDSTAAVTDSSDDETAEEINYSVLEEAEDE